MMKKQDNKMEKNLSSEEIKLTFPRKKQRQNAMQMIYEMEIKNDFTKIKEVNLENKVDDINEEISLSEENNSKNKKRALELIENFIKNDKQNQENLKIEDEDKIIYEASGIYNISKIDIENFQDKKYLIDIVNNIIDNKNSIDSKIQSSLSKNWNINRLSKIDLSILRICIADIEYMGTPYKVAINEALNLAKKYSDEKSSGFINGVLKEYIINNINQNSF